VKAAALINKVYRGYRARVSVIGLAQQMYVKCLDADSGTPYWFNSITDASFWTKPWLLREFDCGQAVVMPADNELCVAPCSFDDCKNNATLYCDECDVLLCASCSLTVHDSGKRREHDVVALSVCTQCGFQLASRNCRQCGDLFCDCCFSWIHKRGRLRLHIADWVCDRCDVCEERAAWIGKLDPDRDYETTLFCRVCYSQVYDDSDPFQDNNVIRVQYNGPSVKVRIPLPSTPPYFIL